MGLDLWFRQDVARILAATWETMHSTAQATRPGASDDGRPGAVVTAEERMAHAYRRGFEDALRAVGVAFGLAEGHNGGSAGHPVVYPRTWYEE
ncbi:MAG: hypothetical protein P8129_13155 [Anaerolineae bacterium]|jgi:hypothetical protein